VKTSFTKKENVESSLALIAILLITSLIWHSALLIEVSIGLIFLALTVPAVFYPFSFIWLNLSHLLGRVSSFVLLAGIFVLVVTPVGVIRRLLGKDRLRLSQFKKAGSSVFEERNHRFVKDDILHPF
jgi:polyferredoxin